MSETAFLKISMKSVKGIISSSYYSTPARTASLATLSLPYRFWAKDRAFLILGTISVASSASKMNAFLSYFIMNYFLYVQSALTNAAISTGPSPDLHASSYISSSS